MEDKTEEIDSVIIYCPNCDFYQGARTKGFGRKYKNKSCILCGKKISLENPIIPTDMSISDKVSQLNNPSSDMDMDFR